MSNRKNQRGNAEKCPAEQPLCWNMAQKLFFQHNKRLRQLAAALPLIPWEARREDRRFTYVDDRAAEMTGFPLEHWYQTGFWQNHLHPDDREETVALCLKNRKEDEEYELEYRMLTADDRTIWIRDIVGVGTGEAGEPILRGFLMNVSEHRELQERVLQITELEQRRLGQDLHDHLGQHLNGLAYVSKSLENSLTKSGHPDAERARQITEHLEEVGRQTHILTHNRYPLRLEADGLLPALRDMAEDTGKHFLVSCRMLEPETPPVIRSRHKALQLYRIAQEAVQNALKHGSPEAITISISSRDKEGRLRIENDGNKLPLHYEKASGMGLHIMKCRAVVIGGRLQVKNRTSGGVIITCTFPNNGE